MFTSRSTATSCKKAPGDAPEVFGFVARTQGDAEWAKQAAAMRALKAEWDLKHSQDRGVGLADDHRHSSKLTAIAVRTAPPGNTRRLQWRVGMLTFAAVTLIPPGLLLLGDGPFSYSVL